MNTNEYYLYEFNPYARINCQYLFEKFQGVPNTVIEVGVYQGNFTFGMTHAIAPNNSNYKHYSIDPFTTSPDLQPEVIEDAYKCFKHNLSISPYSKHIELLRKTSWEGLMDLLTRGVKADLIFIDGDHTSPVVLQDLVLSYNLLNVNGVILCDDSVTWGGEFKLQDTPRLAVDSFIHCFWDKIEVLDIPRSYQTAFRKK